MRAILNGAAPDGGLYVPAHMPQIDLPSLARLSYPEVAGQLLHAFLPDFDQADLQAAVNQAYAAFDTPAVAPLARVGNTWVLELFHGPTAAFKDIALQTLPRLMAQARRQLTPDTAYLVLTATSGDTGSAAMRGFADIDGFSVLVYYPSAGISQVQQAQMMRMPGANLAAIGIRGNFDDAQAAVKTAFLQGEALTGKRLALSSANSINIGRLIPQVVYYIKACQELRDKKALLPGHRSGYPAWIPTRGAGKARPARFSWRLGLSARCPGPGAAAWFRPGRRHGGPRQWRRRPGQPPRPAKTPGAAAGPPFRRIPRL